MIRSSSRTALPLLKYFVSLTYIIFLSSTVHKIHYIFLRTFFKRNMCCKWPLGTLFTSWICMTIFLLSIMVRRNFTTAIDWEKSILITETVNCWVCKTSATHEWNMGMEYWWTDANGVQPKYSEKNESHCHSVHHKSHTGWPVWGYQEVVQQNTFHNNRHSLHREHPQYSLCTETGVLP